MPDPTESRAASVDLSVVVLCYHAEDFVPMFVLQIQTALEQRGLSYELVLVANYDPNERPRDRTPIVVTETVAMGLMRRHPTLKAVIRPKEGMMGWDMHTGLQAATGQTVAVIDGDGQMPVRDILTVYDTLRQGGYDLVVTYRQRRYDGWIRLVTSRTYNRLLRWLFPAVRVRDANSKPKIITRQALAALTLECSGWFADAELVLQAAYRGLRIGEVPTVFYSNERRRSFVRPAAIAEFIGEMLRYRWRMLGRGHGAR